MDMGALVHGHGYIGTWKHWYMDMDTLVHGHGYIDTWTWIHWYMDMDTLVHGHAHVHTCSTQVTTPLRRTHGGVSACTLKSCAS